MVFQDLVHFLHKDLLFALVFKDLLFESPVLGLEHAGLSLVVGGTALGRDATGVACDATWVLLELVGEYPCGVEPA